MRAEYEIDNSHHYSESIVAGTTCGELPFFGDTNRRASVVAEKDARCWVLDVESWKKMQQEEKDVAAELLVCALKLTTERVDAVTRYMYVGA